MRLEGGADMAHEILSIKLRELEDQVARLISRIRLSESADRAALRREIEELELECAESRLALQKKLQLSRADIVSIIAHAYVETERVISEGKDALAGVGGGEDGPECRFGGKDTSCGICPRFCCSGGESSSAALDGGH